eukprot:Nk52_evm80s2192 gene=Nk52_evmTU80s2192
MGDDIDFDKRVVGEFAHALGDVKAFQVYLEKRVSKVHELLYGKWCHGEKERTVGKVAGEKKVKKSDEEKVEEMVAKNETMKEAQVALRKAKIQRKVSEKGKAKDWIAQPKKNGTASNKGSEAAKKNAKEATKEANSDLYAKPEEETKFDLKQNGRSILFPAGFCKSYVNFKREKGKIEESLGIKKNEEGEMKSFSAYSNPQYSIFKNRLEQLCCYKPFLPTEALIYARKLAVYKILKELVQALLSIKATVEISAHSGVVNEYLIRIQYTLLHMIELFKAAKSSGGKCISEVESYQLHTQTIGKCFESSYQATHANTTRFPFKPLANKDVDIWMEYVLPESADLKTCLAQNYSEAFDQKYSQLALFFQKVIVNSDFKMDSSLRKRLERLLLKSRKAMFSPTGQ